MNNNDIDFEFTRRKILAGLGGVGLASAGAGLGTSAFLSDRESFDDNQLTAGELDLKVDWQQSYYDGGEGQVRDDHTTWEKVNAYPDADGDNVQDTILTRDQIAAQEEYTSGDLYEELNETEREEAEAEFRNQFANLPDDFDGPVIDLEDVKPGDEGEITISMHLFDNPGHVWLGADDIQNPDNSVNDPEVAAGDDPESDAGELLDAVEAELWRDVDCDNVRDTGPACVQLVVDNTDSMGNKIDGTAPSDDPDSTTKDQALVDELETLVQSYDDGDDGTLEGVTFGLTLWSEDALTLEFGTDSFGEFDAESGETAATFDPQTDDEAAILGDTSTTDSEATDPASTTGIQNILDQTTVSGNANLANAIDEGGAALAQCPEDHQRIMAIVTNGVTLSSSAYIDKLQSNLRVNGGSVDKYVVIGVQTTGSTKDLLESVESLSGSHEFVAPLDRADIEEAINGTPPFTDPVDGSLANEISATTGGAQEPMLAAGSLRDVLDTIAVENGGILLDGEPKAEGTNCFPNSTTNCVALHWKLPAEVGNEAQTDSAQFTLDFHAEQCRHNAEPTSPFGSTD